MVRDHTQRAMNKKFGNNPKWATLEAKVFVCPRTTVVYQTLKSWGILDNIKGEKRVMVSFQDKITSHHEDFLHLKQHASEPGHKERQIEIKEQRRADFACSAGQMTSAAWTTKPWVLAGGSDQWPRDAAKS